MKSMQTKIHVSSKKAMKEFDVNVTYSALT